MIQYECIIPSIENYDIDCMRLYNYPVAIQHSHAQFPIDWLSIIHQFKMLDLPMDLPISPGYPSNIIKPYPTCPISTSWISHFSRDTTCNLFRRLGRHGICTSSQVHGMRTVFEPRTSGGSSYGCSSPKTPNISAHITIYSPLSIYIYTYATLYNMI